MTWPKRKSQTWDTWDLFWGRAGLGLPVGVYLLSCDLLSRGTAKGKVVCLHLCPYLPGTSLCPLQIPVGAQGSGTFGASGKWNLLKPWDLFYRPLQDHGSPPKLGHGLSRLLPGNFVLENQVGSPCVTNTQIIQDSRRQMVTCYQSWFCGHSQGALWSQGPMLSLMFCCCRFEIFNNFWANHPIFSFYTGSCKLFSPPCLPPQPKGNPSTFILPQQIAFCGFRQGRHYGQDWQ